MRTIGAPFELKDLTDDGSFEGLASVYGNIDLGGDIVEPGAFQEFKFTKDGKIRILDGHNTRAAIGKGDLTDTHIGLAIKGKLNLKIARAREIHELMKDQIIDGLSIGFDTLPGGEEIREGIRHLTKLRLWEVSTTPFPMNEVARVRAVKSIPDFSTIREAEDWVRDELGFTRNAAKEFVVLFKSALANARDEQARDEPIRDAVKETLQILELH